MQVAQVKRYKTIKLCGVPLNDVENRLKDLQLSHVDVSYTTEEFDGRVHITLSASANTEDEAKAMIKPMTKAIRNAFGGYIYSTRSEDTLESAVVKLLEQYELTVSTAESCTGGMLAGRLINVPGVSEVFKEGFVTYTNKSKRKRLGVEKMTLKKHGAVSKQTAKEMVMGLILQTDSDCGLAVTGIAGPDGGTEKKPVGLVYISCFLKDKVNIEEFHFEGNRMEIREQSVSAALNLLRTMILENFK